MTTKKQDALGLTNGMARLLSWWNKQYNDLAGWESDYTQAGDVLRDFVSDELP